MSGNDRLGLVIFVLVYLFFCSAVGFGTMLTISAAWGVVIWVINGYRGR